MGTRHVEIFFSTSDVQMYERSLCESLYQAQASIIHAANYKKVFCMYLRVHSHHDQRITLRSSLMSNLSGTSKSSFRHSSTATFYVCQIRMYFMSEREFNEMSLLTYRIHFIFTCCRSQSIKSGI